MKDCNETYESWFAAEALRYVENGWHVFPLAPRTKLPAISKDNGGRGFHDATNDPEHIEKWGREYPNANIGIATGKVSGIIVVDIDPRNGGLDTIQALAAQGFELPDNTPRQRTGNGGVHVLFAHEPGISCSAGRIGSGVEIKSDGGYVVASPSYIGPSKSGPGGSYQWEISPFQVQPAPLPQWLRSRLVSAPAKPKEQLCTPADDAKLAEIEAALAFIPADDRAFWVRVGNVLYHAFGDAGRRLWDRWSSRSAKYVPLVQERVWRSFKNTRSAGLESIFALAQQHGADLAALAREQRFLYGSAAVRQVIEAAEIGPSAGQHPEKSRPQPEGPAYIHGLNPLDAEQLLRKKFEPVEQVLAPVLPTQGLGMVYGPRGMGKTHVALGMACAVAAGAPFLGWRAPKARRVLLIDGEMPGVVLQQRFAQTMKLMGQDIQPDFFRLVAADLEPDGLPDLAHPDSQAFYEPVISTADLILVDNLSTVCRSMRENEADTWGPVQAWLLRLRRAGKSVVLFHHSGKAGGQRGTSRKEDVLNTVIALRRPPDYSPSEGARFEVHYEKARGFFGDDAEPFEAWLKPKGWTTGPLQQADDSDDTIASLRKSGLSVRDITKRTGVSKSTVDRRLKGLGA